MYLWSLMWCLCSIYGRVMLTFYSCPTGSSNSSNSVHLEPNPLSRSSLPHVLLIWPGLALLIAWKFILMFNCCTDFFFEAKYPFLFCKSLRKRTIRRHHEVYASYVNYAIFYPAFSIKWVTVTTLGESASLPSSEDFSPFKIHFYDCSRMLNL